MATTSIRGVTLASITPAGKDTRWQPGESLQACCPHRWWECTCGIYAHKTREQAVSTARRRLGTVVIGEVELWGRVVEHELGYRAQYARPSALWVPVATEYGSSVVQSLSQRDALRDYGVPVGLCARESGLPVSVEDIRRVFVSEPKPTRPFRELALIVFWKIFQVFLLLATGCLALATGAAGAVVGVVYGSLLPIAVGVVVFLRTGQDPLVSGLLGVGAGLSVCAIYAGVFWKTGAYRWIYKH